ncbi:hypothetical protein JXA63_03890 [Candidatus Woesebacteria bacterium]|nr:hypothetical protein [Candidatus Woesebacteria bacterium]
MNNFARKARIVFFSLLAAFLLTAVPTFAHDLQSGYYREKIIEPLKKLGETIDEYSKTSVPTVPPVKKYNYESEGSVKTNVQININGTPYQQKVAPTVTQQKVTIIPQRECYRYMVTHLDGSTSNLCYSKSDYEQLRSFGYDLSSAKTFYEFHLEGVENYQATYERTGSDIYLDAKASQQQKADREKEKINQITLQMQQIEERGY